MKKSSEFVLGRLVAGALVVAPTYLAVLLVLKGIKSLAGIMKPFCAITAEVASGGSSLLSLLVVLVGCFLDWGGVAPPRSATGCGIGLGEIVL